MVTYVFNSILIGLLFQSKSYALNSTINNNSGDSHRISEFPFLVG